MTGTDQLVWQFLQVHQGSPIWANTSVFRYDDGYVLLWRWPSATKRNKQTHILISFLIFVLIKTIVQQISRSSDSSDTLFNLSQNVSPPGSLQTWRKRQLRHCHFVSNFSEFQFLNPHTLFAISQHGKCGEKTNKDQAMRVLTWQKILWDRIHSDTASCASSRASGSCLWGRKLVCRTCICAAGLRSCGWKNGVLCRCEDSTGQPMHTVSTVLPLVKACASKHNP